MERNEPWNKVVLVLTPVGDATNALKRSTLCPDS
jgi:hypothetical protein